MSEAQVEFVEAQAFTINFPSIGAPMTIRAKGDEVIILMRLRLRPRDNVMNIDFDVSTSGDSATVAGLNQDAAPDFSRYWRAPVPGVAHSRHWSSWLFSCQLPARLLALAGRLILWLWSIGEHHVSDAV